MKEAIEIAIEYNGPVYIRVARDVVPDVELEKDAKMGKAIVETGRCAKSGNGKCNHV